MKKGAYRYAPGEMTAVIDLPNVDLDWFAVSWDITRYNENTGETRIIQFLVIPGLYLIRAPIVRETTWDLDTDWQDLGYYIGNDPRKDSNTLESAIADTVEHLEKGFKMEQEPFVCDFTDFRDDICELVHQAFYSTDPPPLTLGDAYMYNDGDDLPLMIFNHVTTIRSALQKEA